MCQMNMSNTKQIKYNEVSYNMITLQSSFSLYNIKMKRSNITTMNAEKWIALFLLQTMNLVW